MTRLSFLLLVPLIALGACHVARGSGGDNVSMQADENGEVKFNFPFASGNVRLPRGMFANGHFDIDGVKMIPGGTIHGFNMDAGAKGATVHLSFNAPKPPQDVRSYFADQFKARGDEVSESGNAISGRTRQGDQFVIDVAPAPGGSSGTIAVQSRDRSTAR